MRCLEGLPVPATVVNGGATRQASVRAALAVLEGPEIVAVHDAARPFAPPDLFTEVVRAVAAGRRRRDPRGRHRRHGQAP